MMPFLRSKWLRRLTTVVLLFLLFAVGVCAYFRVSRIENVIGYIEMSRGFHPVWKDLALRRINVGDSSVDLLRKHPAPLIVEFGPFAHYEYEFAPGYLSFNSLQITAKDGQLIGAYAGSCTWSHTFFEDAVEAAREEAAYLDDSVEKNVVGQDGKN